MPGIDETLTVSGTVATAVVTDGSATLTVVVPPSVATGGDGNRWFLRLFEAENPGVTVDGQNRIIHVGVFRSDNFNGVRNEINNVFAGAATTSGPSETTTISDALGTYPFSGAEYAVSREISGREALLGGVKDGETVTAQVIRLAASGEFEVLLEAGLNTPSGVAEWQAIARFDHEQLEDPDESNVSTVPVTASLMLRFRHVSGAACRCILKS